MAKSRAQRKAEAAKRRQLQAEQGGAADSGIESDSEAQHDTQVPQSADVLEAEIAIEKGAEEASQVTDAEAPAPSRADQPGGKSTRRDRKRQEREEAAEKKAQLERRAAKAPVTTKERGAVLGFFVSVQKELQKVQWPDRDTLVQASAVTLLFVAVAAAYLGSLDAIFSRLVDVFIT